MSDSVTRTLGADEKFCSSCGSIIKKAAEICVKCGVRQGGVSNEGQDYGTGRKDWLTTLLMCLFLGPMGVHRFYTGSTGIGVVQLFTGGGCGIWWLIDMISIFAGSYKDGSGKPLVKK